MPYNTTMNFEYYAINPICTLSNFEKCALFKFFSKAKVLYKKLFKANPPPLTHRIIDRAKSARACPNLEVLRGLALAKPNNDDGNPNN